MTNNIEVVGINERQNIIMYDLMQPEAAGLEEILEDPTYKAKEAYDDLRNGEAVEDALGFTYLIKDDEEHDIMKALNKLYKSGLSLDKIKKAMNDWQTEFYTEIWSDGLAEYKEFIIAKRTRINGSAQDNITKKERNEILGEIEKRMDFHMKWGFTMAVLKKFEAPFKNAVTKIQTRQRGNKDRAMLEAEDKWYMDYTSHWKKNNKRKIEDSLSDVMIDEDMTDERKTKARTQISEFLLDNGFSSKKKKTKKKPKKKKSKKSKKKKKKKKKP